MRIVGCIHGRMNDAVAKRGRKTLALATMERAKMVFIILVCSAVRWLGYTDDSLIYSARLEFFSLFFFSKRSKFRLSHQLF